MLDALVNTGQSLGVLLDTAPVLSEEVIGEEDGGWRLEVLVVRQGFILFQERDNFENYLLNGCDLEVSKPVS